MRKNKNVTGLLTKDGLIHNIASAKHNHLMPDATLLELVDDFVKSQIKKDLSNLIVNGEISFDKYGLIKLNKEGYSFIPYYWSRFNPSRKKSVGSIRVVLKDKPEWFSNLNEYFKFN